MPPSQIKAPLTLAARLAAPTATGNTTTNTTRLVMALSEQLQAKAARESSAASTASAYPAATSSFVMPPSSQFVGASATGGSRGVAVGVACGIVAVFLVVVVIAMSMHADAGKGRYSRSSKNAGVHGADTFQLRPSRQPQSQPQSQLQPGALSVSRAPATGGNPFADGLPVHHSPRPGSWKSSLDDRIARCMEVVRNWRV